MLWAVFSVSWPPKLRNPELEWHWFIGILCHGDSSQFSSCETAQKTSTVHYADWIQDSYLVIINVIIDVSSMMTDDSYCLARHLSIASVLRESECLNILPWSQIRLANSVLCLRWFWRGIRQSSKHVVRQVIWYIFLSLTRSQCGFSGIILFWSVLIVP